ncbi:MAG: SH3 domain-containing protein [Hasllibacter sp.]
MTKVITASLLFLAYAFFEASGGHDFVPAPQADAPRVVASQDAADGARRLVAILGPEGAQAAAADPAVATAAPEAFPVTVAALSEEAFQARTGLTAAASLDADLRDVRQLAAEAAPLGEVRTISGDRVNMRTGPGTGFGVIRSWPYGTEAVLLETEGNWGRIVIDGTEGWMSTRLLEG